MLLPEDDILEEFRLKDRTDFVVDTNSRLTPSYIGDDISLSIEDELPCDDSTCPAGPYS